MLTDDIEQARAIARGGLETYPHGTVFQHASSQLSMLKSLFLNDGAAEPSILFKFDLGLMAARELGLEDCDLADVLHRIQRQVESLRQSEQVGNWARASGYGAILAPSARNPDGANLVVFPGD